jgi:hypothetical protein
MVCALICVVGYIQTWADVAVAKEHEKSLTEENIAISVRLNLMQVKLAAATQPSTQPAH